MAAIKGPAVFLAHFLRDVPPLNTLENICKWFADPGYAGVRSPAGIDASLILTRPRPRTPIATSLKESLPPSGYQSRKWQLISRARCSRSTPPGRRCRFSSIRPAGNGTRNVPVLSGGFAWHMIYPWPQRPPGLIDEALPGTRPPLAVAPRRCPRPPLRARFRTPSRLRRP
jgi:hypothetical protein